MQNKDTCTKCYSNLRKLAVRYSEKIIHQWGAPNKQKQSSGRVPIKKRSEFMQQIYRRTPMPVKNRLKQLIGGGCQDNQGAGIHGLGRQ